MKRGLLIGAFVVLLGVGGCGEGGAESSGPQTATLALDSPPNAIHVGIYAGRAKGFYRRAGIRLKIERPGKAADTPQQLANRRVDFAILDIHDLGIAREQGLDLVGVLPLVQRPLVAVLSLYDNDVKRPRDLEGHTVGVTGRPFDDAILDAEVAADGGDPTKVKKVAIGFNSVAALAAGRVDAVTAFWNSEGVTLRRRFIEIRIFNPDEFGAPPYPELILATSRRTLDEDPDLVEAVIAATKQGYAFTLKPSTRALNYLLRAHPRLDPEEQGEQLSMLTPYLGPKPFLRRDPFEPKLLREWADWDLENGIFEKPLDVEEAFDFD